MGRILAAVMSDRSFFRNKICQLLEGVGTLDVLNGANLNGESAASVVEMAPDVLVMEAGAYAPQAPTFARQVMGLLPRTTVVAIVESEKDPAIPSLVEAGVMGIILDKAPREELLRVIQSASSGRRIVDRAIGRRLSESVLNETEGQASGAFLCSLTGREIEVLKLVAEGKRNSQIALSLGLSDQTVKAHLSNIFSKLGVNSRTAAALVGVKHGWFAPVANPPGGGSPALQGSRNDCGHAPATIAHSAPVAPDTPSVDARTGALPREEIALMFGHLLDEIGEGCWLIQNERVAYANPTIANMFGYSQKDLVGIRFEEVLPTRLRAPIRQLHRMRLAGQRVPTRYSVTAERRNGSVFVARVSVSAVWHKHERIVVASISDAGGKCPGEDDVLRWLTRTDV